MVGTNMNKDGTSSLFFLLPALTLTAYGFFHLGRTSKMNIISSSSDSEKESYVSNKEKNHHEEVVDDTISMKPIGNVSSVYRLCVGTPRQGLLAPSSRGRIDFYPNRIAPDSILELEKFSHIWVVFIFHLNSNVKTMEESKQSMVNGKKNHRRFPSKIAPPALGGKRVGIFATRSPHRPNPVGFTLCKIDKIVIPPKKKHEKHNDTPYHIYVSGIDLVDGTPVLDIKPYVPYYDSVGFEDMDTQKNVNMPKGVSEGLGKRRSVSFTGKASNDLLEIMSGNDDKQILDFYGKHSGRDSNDEDALQNVKNCIEEVLSVDVRSRWQTDKARKGKFQAERAIRVKSLRKEEQRNVETEIQEERKSPNICTQQIDRLLIKYIVKEDVQDVNASAVDTFGSGADDDILIVGIEYIS